MATRQVFIALQCCECFTMQVKQQKKSSNKWVCVVCNQKQSVRKVFARGYLARDVRGFVQRFNMSRMTAGGSDSVVPGQIGKDLGEDIVNCDRSSPPPVPSSGNVGYPRPRRTDWSEYLDPDEEEYAADASNEAISAYSEGVTEMFRRPFPKRPPNLRNAGVKDAFKPTFPKRKQKQSSQPQLQLQESGGWKKRPRVATEGSSRWSEYLQEDPDETPEEVDSPDPYVRWGGDGDGHGRLDDVRFEEEVHPDFR